MPPAHEPTRDELLAMAYADGELGSEGRRELEVRLAREPQLARQVSEHRALQVLARRMAPPEPADLEWARLEAEPVQRSTRWLGWTLFVGGSIGLAAWGLWGVANSHTPILPRVLAMGAILGLLLLLLTTARARMRVLPHDPYRKVER